MLAFASLSAVLLIGCGSTSPDPEEVISKAQEAIKEVQSYRVESTSISTDERGTTESSDMAEFVTPDRMHVLPVIVPDNVDAVESIRIGNTEYRREPDTNRWQVHQWPESISSINFAVTLTESLTSLVGLENLPDEKVDGVDCFHYTGYVDTKAMAEERKAKLDPSQRGYEGQLESIKAFENMQYDYEFWIGKEDFLLRQLKMHMEVSYTRNEGEENEKEEYQNILNTYRFYDFNAPITIEAPLTELVEGVLLTARMRETGSGGGDPEHQQMQYEITVSNGGTEMANNLRLFVDTPITDDGLQTYEAEAGTVPVNLGPDESETYCVSWEFNLIVFTKDRFLELIRQNVLRATWIDEKGQQHEKVLRKGG